MQLYTIPEAARIMRMSQPGSGKNFQERNQIYAYWRRIFIPESTINEIFDRAVVNPRNHEK